MYIWWLTYASLLGLSFVSGLYYGHRGEARYWRNHAGPSYRSAVCSHSEFYYVIPENEYVELELDHCYITKLREECGIYRD